MEQIWDHCYSGKMQLKSKDHPLLMSEAAWNTEKSREKSLEIAFEKFEVPAYFPAKDAVLACFSVGRGAGLVINSGHQVTSVVAVYEGHVLTEPIRRTRCAGDFLNQKLAQTLKNSP
eukprot:UN04526